MAVAKKPSQAKSRPSKSTGMKAELKAGSNSKDIIFPEGGLRGVLNRVSKKSSTSEDFYLLFNGYFRVDKDAILREVKQGIKSAEGWHRKNTGVLKLLSLDKSCRPPRMPSDKLKTKINSLLKDPNTKQAATAYIASRKSLNSLLIASQSIKSLKDGAMRKKDLQELFLGYQYLGVANFLCKSDYLNDDLNQIIVSAKKLAGSSRYAELKAEVIRLSELDENKSREPSKVARSICMKLRAFADSYMILRTYKNGVTKPVAKPLKKLSEAREEKTISDWIRDYRKSAN